MNKLLNVLALATCGAAALSLSVSTAQAQDWPTDDVRLIVPYAPGGTTDLVPALRWLLVVWLAAVETLTIQL